MKSLIAIHTRSTNQNDESMLCCQISTCSMYCRFNHWVASVGRFPGMSVVFELIRMLFLSVSIFCYRKAGVLGRNNYPNGETYKSSLRFMGKTNLASQTLINQANVLWKAIKSAYDVFRNILVLLDRFAFNWYTWTNVFCWFRYGFNWFMGSIEWMSIDLW